MKLQTNLQIKKYLSFVFIIFIPLFLYGAPNGNPLQDKYGIKDTSSVLLKVQLGLIPDSFIVHMFGRNNNVGTVVETLSELSTLMPYPMSYTSPLHVNLVSSSNDTHQITIIGLDQNGNLQQENVTLNGITQVQSQYTYSRIFDAYNSSSYQLTGTVTIKANGNSIGTLDPINQKLYNAVYTIPKGYTGYLIGGTVSSGKSKDITFGFAIRYYQKTFVTVDSVYTYESTIYIPRPYQSIPELSDIEIRVSSTQTGSSANGSFTLLLIKNGTFQ